ncbi:hypothetical protein MBLNU13_g07636t1 [Cladosporium sp. NU13]
MACYVQPLDVFGQNPRLNGLYTQLCFMFPLDTSDPASTTTIESFLREALERLAENVAWVGGRVVKSRSGHREIQISGSIPSLTVKLLGTELPTYECMRQAGFPFSMLDETVIAPCPTLPGPDEDNTPVFMVQANSVQGGVLLVFNAQHNCMDLRGQVQLIELFAQACRGQDFSPEQLEVANMTEYRLKAPSGTSPTEPGAVQADHGLKPPQQRHDLQDRGQSRWSYFAFSAANLRRLKELAAADKFCDFISTDDALSALLWQASLRCRKVRLSTTDVLSTFERQVDARKHVGAPHAYMGNMVFKSSTKLRVADVDDMSLGQIASHLRRALSPEPNIEYQMCVASKKAQAAMGNAMHSQARIRPSLPVTDFKLSSWAQERCYDVDFGGCLGVPEVVRRPSFEAWEGLSYFMPRTPSGDIFVAVCLNDGDLERLREDKEFCNFGAFVG